MERITRATRQVVSRWTLRRLAVATLFYWLPVLLGIQLCRMVAAHHTTLADVAVLRWLNSQANPELNAIMPLVTTLGGGTAVLLLATLAAIVALRHRRAADALQIAAAVGGAVVLSAVMKVWFQRPRPQLWQTLVSEHSYSFPSAHAMMSSALALSLILVLWPTRWRLAALALGLTYIAVIGFSRVYLGVHYATDVLAGWCISLVWVLAVAAAIRGQWPGLGRH